MKSPLLEQLTTREVESTTPQPSEGPTLDEFINTQNFLQKSYPKEKRDQ